MGVEGGREEVEEISKMLGGMEVGGEGGGGEEDDDDIDRDKKHIEQQSGNNNINDEGRQLPRSDTMHNIGHVTRSGDNAGGRALPLVQME